ncbi:MAG: class I SAM-dependent methyltransferase [Bacteroidetes bacterium]|nr:class I SAM-dependent methyltransferase [Bacteroidota bacterium]
MSSDLIANIHKNKAHDTYFTLTNDDLVALFPNNPGRILDIGCAEGRLGEDIIKLKHPAEYIGIEIVPSIAEIAKTRLDDVLVGQAEEILETIETGSFNWVILADSLEHTIDPWTVIKEVSRILPSGGRLLVSMPNVRNLNIILDLFKNGNWTYTSHGILDQGHLRFFTKSSILNLITSNGFSVQSCRSNPRNRWKKLPGKTISKLLSWFIGKPSAYEEFITVQWIIVAEKK